MLTDWNIDEVINHIFQLAVEKYPPAPDYENSTRRRTEDTIREMQIKFSGCIDTRSVDDVKQEVENYRKGFVECFDAANAIGYNFPDNHDEHLQNGNLFEYYSCITYIRMVIDEGLGTIPVSNESNKNLVWQTEARVLYDIFGQLLTMKLTNGDTPISKNSQTVKQLARMIYHNFSFSKGNPSINQIERELQKMVESDSTVSIRNKITIEFKGVNDSL